MNRKYKQLNEALMHEASDYMKNAAVAMLVMIVMYLAFIMYKFSKLINKSRQLPGLTKRLREIEPSVSWDVYLVNDKNKLSVFSLGKRSVFVSERALEYFEDDELVSLMLHSIYMNNHSQQFKKYLAESTMGIALATLGVMVYDTIASKSLNQFRSTDTLFVVITILVSYAGINLLGNRRYKADNYTIRKGYGRALIRAFKKISDSERFDDRSCKGLSCKVKKNMSALFSSQPDIDERILSAKKEIKVQSDMKHLTKEIITSTFKDVAKDQLSDMTNKLLKRALTGRF